MSDTIGVVGAPVAPYSAGLGVPIQVDTQGRVVTVGSGGGGTTVNGGDTPSDAFGNPTDAVTTWSLNGIWDGANWQRQLAFQFNGAVNDTSFGIPTAALGYSKRTGTDWEPTQGGDLTEPIGQPSHVPYNSSFSLMKSNAVASWIAATGDANHNLQVIGGTPPATGGTASPSDISQASATVTTGIIKNSPGKLLAIDFSTLVTLGGWLQLFNRTTALSGGETPVWTTYIPINAAFVKQLGREFWSENGKVFSIGIVWGISTIPATYTAVAASPASMNVSFV